MRTATAAVALALAATLTAPAQAEDTLRKALETDITISFAKTPLSEVITAVRELAQLNIVLDPELNPKAMLVDADASGQKVDAFLRDVEKAHNLQRSVWCGAVYLHPRGNPPGPEPTQGSDVEALNRPLTVYFLNTSLQEAMERLKGRTGVDFVIPARVKRHLDMEVGRLDLHLWSLPPRYVVTLLANEAGLVWSLKDGKIEFDLARAHGQANVDADQVRVAADPNLSNLDPQAEDVDKLIAALADPGKRRVATERLIRVGAPAADRVAAALVQPDEVAIACCHVLAKIGGEGQVTALLRLFRDAKRSLEARTAAGMALGDLKSPKAVPYLIDSLGDTWFKVSETARNALVQMGEPVVEPLRHRYAVELRKPNGNDGIIYRALLIFGQIGGDTARGVLERALKAKQGPRAMSLRHHAAIGLGFTKDYKAVEPLLNALKTEDEFLVAKYITRSLNWITGANLPPNVSRWEIWWSQNKDKVQVKAGQSDFEPLEPDFGGLPDLGEGDR